uniref:Restriction endonuclease n=1 Tax=Candidatus Kentrum sp. MB TaxID=2138164 RepID=A0A450XG76_9GAMM|nr:MAG: hypothetical protein BECKMB1821G_GA0114241_103510 [Candidatus Kentron sp. MB]VFK32544.1 MAG: hypothetical protein BECKMB1821I_GA0114274_103425 [Candidatus Kentron sp. MB]VFK75972.1 MAG: hypothetical protein BECKMB1821H_GA0114242_103725 [Candidatus Kentron sp. MB]
MTDARFGILTNGIQYQFYSDIDDKNIMDSRPFFEFNLLDFQEHQIEELKKFTKSSFSLDDILNTASTLKYTGAVKKILEEELKDPSEDFIRFFASRIYDGRITKSVLLYLSDIVKEARKQFINEKINERLKSALSAADNLTNSGDLQIEEKTQPQEETDNKIGDEESDGIITTQEEIEGYNIVKAILREVVNVRRVAMRDTKSYCGILLDDNNRKPICRLHFNYEKKYIGVFSQKNEKKLPIDDLDDIFKYADYLTSVISEYDSDS